jgi:hypothetical protein
MHREKKIEILIKNDDFVEVADAGDQTEAILLNAVKRAFLENDIDSGNLRLGTYNVNTAHAQIGKFDKPFHEHDYRRLFNQFLKGISFKEKRVITLFAEPIPFQYSTYSIVEDEGFQARSEKKVIAKEQKEFVPKVKLSIPTAMLVVNEMMEFFLVPVI